MISEPEPHHVVHVTHRKTYKRCRRQWDWECRQELEPRLRPIPFEFGTAVHAALQTYYDPMTWKQDRTVIQEASLAAFTRTMRDQWTKYLADVGDEGPDAEHEVDWHTHLDLGIGMLRGYFKFAVENDNFEPWGVETVLRHEIPGILCPCHQEPIFLQGKFDLLVHDQYGEFWLHDHKTTATFYSNMLDFLSLDDQLPLYAWLAWKVLGIRVAGASYNELRKAVPSPPRVLKSGKLSVDKSQATSLELYLQALHERGFNPYDYAEYLSYLRDNPKEYFRRFNVHRTTKELNILEAQLRLEVAEMVDPNIAIYPNPSKPSGHCAWCDFRTPCLLTSEGGDALYMLDHAYVRKT